MIKLYYTGAGMFNTAQTLASKSIGGFISNTPVPNGVANSLFTPLSLMEFYKNKKTVEYIGLGLYLFFFDEEQSYDNIDLKFRLSYSEENEEEASFFKDSFIYKVGLAPISGDSTNGYYIEKITSGAKPFYMLQDFKELVFDEEVIFEDVELSNSGVGIWLCRVFDPKKFKETFGFEADYWKDNDKLPNLDFILNLNVSFEGNESGNDSGESSSE